MSHLNVKHKLYMLKLKKCAMMALTNIYVFYYYSFSFRNFMYIKYIVILRIFSQEPVMLVLGYH